ncbi:8923_t:CDS:2 [Funneliformis mosseae]|uniref:8923_t:CDS:1 n=1 Tax=Funneliformis mosseae TaxID=27381 RepID=A0A9N8ZJ79_FUNMO|nr:8923_t:CDS:2 [Funneliformis mosseae]
MNYTIMYLKNDSLDPSHYVLTPEMFNNSLYKSKNGIRKGIIITSHQYTKVNNSQYSDYEFSKLNFWIMYEDMNALYLASDAKIGYILEVNLKTLLNLYNERLVKDKEVGNGKYMSGEKLVQTLFIKKNYVVHYRAFQTYIKFRIKVKKIHSALKFQQSLWMKDYIEKNICKRKIAKANRDKFEIIYYKLKNNIVFDKQMKNVHKHMRVELL